GVEAQSLKGLVDFTALQHSTVKFAFAFTRPAVSARLELTATAVKKGKAGPAIEARAKSFPLKLSPDATAGSVTLPALASGTYRVVLEAEHGVRTERDGGALTVNPDLPPALVRFYGQEDGRAAHPTEAVAFRVRLADDVGVARADLLYTINGSKKVFIEPFALDGAGRKEA